MKSEVKFILTNAQKNLDGIKTAALKACAIAAPLAIIKKIIFITLIGFAVIGSWNFIALFALLLTVLLGVQVFLFYQFWMIRKEKECQFKQNIIHLCHKLKLSILEEKKPHEITSEDMNHLFESIKINRPDLFDEMQKHYASILKRLSTPDQGVIKDILRDLGLHLNFL